MISCSLYRKTFFAPEKQQKSPLPPPRPPKPEKLKYKYSAVAPPIHPRKCEEVPVPASTKWKPTPFPRLSLAKKTTEKQENVNRLSVPSLQRPVGVAMRFPMSTMAVSIDVSASSVPRTSPGSKDSGLTHSGSSAITEERSFDDDFVRRIKRWDSRSSRSDTRSDKNTSFEIATTSSKKEEQLDVNDDFFDCQGLDAELLKIERERLSSLREDDLDSLSNFTSITNQHAPSEVGSELSGAKRGKKLSALAHFNANAKIVSPMEKNMRVLQWIHCCRKALKTSNSI